MGHNAEEQDPLAEPAPPPAGADPALETLRRLEERLDRASGAAERLLAQAATEAARAVAQASGGGSSAEGPGAAGGAGDPAGPGAAGGGAGSSGGGVPPSGEEPDKPPPGGWQFPGAGAQTSGGRPVDGELLVQFVQSLRDLIPPELQRRLAEALREVLLAIRALIDWYIERLEQRRREPAKVEDIPIL